MSIASIESGIVAIAKKIKAGIEIAGEDALKIAGFLQANQAEITGLAALAGSKTSNVVATGQTVWAKSSPPLKARVMQRRPMASLSALTPASSPK
jgi:hypothetical protein